MRPVEFGYADPVRGELRRDVNVVPLVAVGLDSKLLVVPLGDGRLSAARSRAHEDLLDATDERDAAFAAAVRMDVCARPGGVHAEVGRG